MVEAEFDLEKEMDEIRKEKRKPAQKQVTEKTTKPKKAAAELAATDIEGEILKELQEFREEQEEAAEPAGEVMEEPRIYVVQRGDSLSKIAKEVYGNAGRWREIYEANKDQIEDPGLIRPGWELRIP
jgi:nucleoid-associated protein YgaU